MAVKAFVNEQELRQAIAILKPGGELFEVRIIGKVGRKKIISGYFRDVDALMEAFKTVDLSGTNVYITLNQIDESLYSRAQRDCFRATDNTTKDKEITGYEWMFIDLDPIRPEGISSSDAEIQAAYRLAGKVYKYLQGLGFEEPIKAVSGNGAHLLYPVQLGNNSENENLMKSCLNVLAELFNTDKVKIDTVNFNPARICKLYGTLAQKGSNTAERPHRMSKIFSAPDVIKPTDRAYLEKLSAELPAPSPAQPATPARGKFDLEEWMARYGLRPIRKDVGDSCTIYPLEECPFDHSHTDGDSKIFLYNDGAIAFKCHHNSCHGKKWQDVRIKFEPDAYANRMEENDRRIEEGWKRHNASRKLEAEKIVEEKPDAPMFLSASMILSMPEPENEFIRSGITLIDKKMRGLEKKMVTVVTGIRGSAKSTWLSEVALTVVDDGGTVVCYSGELSAKNFMRWMNLQAAGKANVTASAKYENFFTPNPGIPEKIAKWLGDKFWLYNNRYGNEFKGVAERIEAEILKRKADLCILDNLMALDLGGNKQFINQSQTDFVWTLKDIALRCNCHIIFVAHPRKPNGFLRGDDISGTGNLLNAADNGFIIHRANKDFWKGLKEFDKDECKDLEILKPTNVIEVVKARESGLQDEFIPLYYEQSTKRLRNTTSENVVYGWDKDMFDPCDGREVPF